MNSSGGPFVLFILSWLFCKSNFKQLISYPEQENCSSRLEAILHQSLY